MVLQEIYILTKHANFSAQYVENLPTWKRRYYIDFLVKEVDMMKEQQDAEIRKAKSTTTSSRGMRKR